MDEIWEAIARNYVPFIANVGLLALLAWGVSLLVRNPFAFDGKQSLTKALGIGLLFGATSSVLMFMPIELEPGIFGDGRGAPLLLAGLVGGPVAAVVTTTIAALTRYGIGGAGMPAGVLYVVIIGSIGFGYHFLIHLHKARRPDVVRLALVAAVASAATSPVILLLPPDKQFSALITIWPKLSLANVFGVAILGSLLGREMERLKWESALVDSEQRFRDYAASASDWYWETDEEGRFTYLSERFGEVTGLDATELLGKHRMQIASENTDNAKWSQHLEVLRQQRPFRDFSYRYRISPERVITTQANGIPVFDIDGDFKGYRGIGADITKRVEAEEELRRARDAAEEANKAKSIFLANMSHELRTPLNAIIGFAEIIKDEHMGSGSSKYPEYAGDIHESATHLVSLISDILDLSKIESGTASDLDEEEVDIFELAASVERLVMSRALKNGVNLEFDIAENSPYLLVDQRRLKQILVNLLTNAIKFSHRGSTVSLTAHSTENDGYRIQVRDHGIGMAPKDIPQAMSVFGQIDNGIDRKYEGTGLGLPLTKALVEQHGGQLELESAPDVGTCVTIHLPPTRVLASYPACFEEAKAAG